MKNFIVVAGNIGVGKSTLVEKICGRLNSKPYYEPVAENPYISDFYKDMLSWSFHSQIFFLTHRLRIHQEIVHYSGSVIQDRSIYEDAEVFAQNLFTQGLMSERDFSTYISLYRTLTEYLPPPNLMIYLRASVPTLLTRISLRNRDYEHHIDPDYLSRLNTLYENWIDNFTLCPVLTVPSDDLDYVSHPHHLELIIRKIQEKLSGKDDVIFPPFETKKA